MARNFMFTCFYFQCHFFIWFVKCSAKVPCIVVFGDSSVDSGNNNHISTVVKSNFKPYGRDFYGGQATGRFSNGRVFSDFVSEAFRIKPTIPAYLDPQYNITDFSTGVCFASAGSGYDNSTADVLSVIPLWKELEYYKKYQEELRAYMGRDGADNVLKESLYLICLGTNDFMENYYLVPGRSLKYSIEEYQKFLIGIARNFVTELHSIGARKISISRLPPMGCMPLERAKNIMFGNRCVETYNNVAKQFNHKLGDLVDTLNKELNGIRVVSPDPYDFLMDIIYNPKSHGFENGAQACCGTGLFEMGYLCDKNNPFTCADANKYVFWDAFHPTEKTNQLVAYHTVETYLTEFM